MAAVLSILTILLFFQAICGLWLLVKAYEASFGWFALLLATGLAATMGSSVAGVACALATLVFTVKYWHMARKPALLLLAAGAVHTLVVVQAGKALKEPEAQQARTQQVR